MHDLIQVLTTKTLRLQFTCIRAFDIKQTFTY